MPSRQNDPSHRHSETPAAPRRKSKPKFELPPETESAAHDVGWVYRADEELPPVNIQETVAEVAEEVRHVPAAELAAEAVLTTGKVQQEELPPLPPVKQDPPNVTSVAVMTGMGVLAIGMIATGLVTLAAFSLMTAPVRFARRYLTAK
jgi:hypothetical protein